MSIQLVYRSEIESDEIHPKDNQNDISADLDLTGFGKRSVMTVEPKIQNQWQFSRT